MQLGSKSDGVTVMIDAERGGRIASLEVAGHQLLVVDGSMGTLQWGSYPMVPWAGRVRRGRFQFRGTAHELPCNLPPHSAHGVGFTAAWSPVGPADESELALELLLGDPWPFGGRAVQRFSLDDRGLVMTLTVEASTEMPVMVGWHPWFNRSIPGPEGPVEAELSFGPAMMYELDNEAIPTGELVTVPTGPWDNCFTSLQHPPSINWPGLLRLALSSSCDHWVIYTEPEAALCVEPQSAAPDVFNRDPRVIGAGQAFEAWFRLEWS